MKADASDDQNVRPGVPRLVETSTRSNAAQIALVSGTAAAFDQVTKAAILQTLEPFEVVGITPFFNLTLTFNTGVSFGMLSDTFASGPLLLAAFSLLIAAGLLVWALRTPKLVERVSLSLMAGGAVGNSIDRIRQGAVTDFLDFYIGDWHWPTFNGADIAIFIGAVLLVAGDLFRREPAVPGDAQK